MISRESTQAASTGLCSRQFDHDSIRALDDPDADWSVLTTENGHREWTTSRTSGPRAVAARARPGLALRQSPRSLRNRSVYWSGVVLETELHVGEAYVSEQGVSRSSDQ
ncbi:hypothetical protein SRB17_78540 [Streptomyces sp. RB17]|nr:hypothetical protein [Streptomyces sp. RB17]